MKHIAFIIFLISTYTTVFSQENIEHKSISKQFLKQTGSIQLLDSIIKKEQAKITTSAPRFFNQKKLDFSIEKDKLYSINNINEYLSFIKEDIYNELMFKLKRYKTKSLKKLIKKRYTRKYNYTLIKNDLNNYIRERINEELSKLNNNIIPIYLKNIIQRHKKISLKVMLNNQIVSTKDLDINLILITNCPEHKKIIILDKENSEINKPKKCEYKQIKNLVINYKGYDFIFEAKTTKINFPSQLVEIKSLLSKYSFEEIPNWNIYIDETKEYISIEIENVVQVKKSIDLLKNKIEKTTEKQIFPN